MTRSTTAGETLVAMIIVDPDGNPAHLVDTDGQSLLSAQSRNMLWDTSLLKWVRQTVTYQGGGSVPTGTVSSYQAGSWTVGVNNFPSTQAITGSISNTGFNVNNTVALALSSGGAAIDPRAIRALTSSDQVTIANASIPVTGTFWQATQPVSIASMPSTPVTGTFWQATQPVSLATNTPDVTDRAARLLGHVTVDSAPTTAVTGTFWQATQPVSLATNTPDVTDRAARLLGHVTVDNASLPVTGTFWQATQPVSLATNTPDVTDRVGRLLGHVTVDNASLAVTGTFWQATQPVSGTITSNIGTTNGLALDATLTGGTALAQLKTPVKGSTAAGTVTSEATDANTQSLHTRVTNASIAVTGTFWQATQPISGNVGLLAGTNYVGKTRQTDGTLDLTLLNSAPVSDTGQVAVPVRVISSLAAGGGGSNAAAGTIGSAVGTSASYSGLNVGGTLRGATGVNPSGTVYAQQIDLASMNGTALGAALPVSGTFWQATQPVSGTVTGNQGTAAALSGAWPVKVTDGTNTLAPAVEGNTFADTKAGYLLLGRTGGSGAGAVAKVALVDGGGNLQVRPTDGTNYMPMGDAAARTIHTTIDNATVAVTGTFWQATQPVSGTVTSNIGTTNGLALDATLTGGSAQAQIKTPAKGLTAAGNPTSLAVDANTQALHTTPTAYTFTFTQDMTTFSNSSVYDLQGSATTAVMFSGLTNGTKLEPQVSVDNVTWVVPTYTTVPGGTASGGYSGFGFANGAVFLATTGYKYFRVSVKNNFAGVTATIVVTTASAAANVTANAYVTNSSLPVTQSGTWTVGLTGGSNYVRIQDSNGNNIGTNNSALYTIGTNAATNANITAYSGFGAFALGSYSTSVPAANSSLDTAYMYGFSSVMVIIYGSWTGQLVFEGVDSLNHTTPLNASTIGTGLLATSTTTNGVFRINGAGFNYVRVRQANASPTGTASVICVITGQQSTVGLSEPLPAGTNLIGNVKLTDGTNYMPTGDSSARSIHTTLDNASIPVTGTFWQATQPVSIATNTPDVTDRAARLLGHVTVDSAPTTAVTGTFWQATQPITGPVTDTSGNAVSVGLDAYKNTLNVRDETLHGDLMYFNRQLLHELQMIRYAMGKLIGEYLTIDNIDQGEF